MFYLLLYIWMKFSCGEDESYIDVSGVTFDDDNNDDYSDDSCSRYLEEGLCIPLDTLEEIGFFSGSDWNNDMIRLDDSEAESESVVDASGTCCSSSADVDVESSVCGEEFGLSFERCFICAEQEDEWNSCKKPRSKRGRKHRDSMLKGERRRICGHCQAVNTPQWRAGPPGLKTLCNACGLRYKLGRLVSAYRPASSPTFDSAQHSNFYKRISRKSYYVTRRVEKVNIEE